MSGAERGGKEERGWGGSGEERGGERRGEERGEERRNGLNKALSAWVGCCCSFRASNLSDSLCRAHKPAA